VKNIKTAKHIVMVGGVFTLVRLSEKSITEWNDDNYYEKD
jgi:hypothetical protein